MQLKSAQHATFTDVPLLLEATGVRKDLGREGETFLGTLDSLKCLEIIVAYTSGFADYILLGKNSTLLDKNRRKNNS